ncbi:hypothetical protein TNCV_2346241 [Trichonephila clavipes]|nr:hypothetical protein TNCV_2346241 [Trichonephila clavipes]
MEGFVNTSSAGSRHLRSVSKVIGWTHIQTKKLFDLLVVYGYADCNFAPFNHCIQERYPNRRVPHRIFFARVIRKPFENSPSQVPSDEILIAGIFATAGRLYVSCLESSRM